MNGNKNLLILGAGGHGRVFKETAEAMDIFDRIEFLDDNPDCNISIGKCGDFEHFISVGAIIDHDSFIGYDCHVSCGALVKADCIVRAMTTVVSGAVVTKDDNHPLEDLIG